MNQRLQAQLLQKIRQQAFQILFPKGITNQQILTLGLLNNLQSVTNTHFFNQYLSQQPNQVLNSQQIQNQSNSYKIFYNPVYAQGSSPNNYQNILSKKADQNQQNNFKIKFQEKSISSLEKQPQNNQEVKLGQEKQSQYIPQEYGSSGKNHILLPQTKNIIVNFVRAAMNFIIKQKKKAQIVCQMTNTPKKQFRKYVMHNRTSISSLYQLRQLWKQQTNKYAKPLRILSTYFFRKAGLKHIFNSKIQSYSKYLKYRIKLMNGAESPSQFTQLKLKTQ